LTTSKKNGAREKHNGLRALVMPNMGKAFYQER
jgi:hypothetical protein